MLIRWPGGDEETVRILGIDSPEVRHDEHGRRGSAEPPREILVLFLDTCDTVTDEDDDVGLLGGSLRLSRHESLDARRIAYVPSGVHESERPGTPVDRDLQSVARDSRQRVRYRFSPPVETVQ